MLNPPSTTIACPVIQLASSDNRKATAPATSSALPTLGSGVRAASQRRSRSSLVQPLVSPIPAAIEPGQTAFTVTFARPTSAAREIVRPRMPALAAP